LQRAFLAVAAAAVVLLAAPSAHGQYAYRVEPNHSSIAFVVPIAGGMTKVRGSFNKFEVDMVHDESNPSQWSVKAAIEVASIHTGIADRDKDLLGEAFFDAAHHPQITFTSQRIEKRGDKYIAYGDLVIRGIRKAIALEFVITGYQHDKSEPDSRPIFGASARATLNRLEFKVGADWKHTLIPNFIGNDIAIEIDLWTRGGRKIASNSR